MSKKYYWEIEEAETDAESGEFTGSMITHKVELVCSKLTGKAVITINGTKFDISEKPFSLAGTQQMFRLGDMPAQITFNKKGDPTIMADNKEHTAKKL